MMRIILTSQKRSYATRSAYGEVTAVSVEYLGEELRIGYSNGKQLLKRLELFGVTLAEVEEAMHKYSV